VAVVLIAALGAAIYGIVLMGARHGDDMIKRQRRKRRWWTRRRQNGTRTGGLADRRDEQALSKEAIRLIDHELDWRSKVRGRRGNASSGFERGSQEIRSATGECARVANADKPCRPVDRGSSQIWRQRKSGLNDRLAEARSSWNPMTTKWMMRRKT